LRNKFWPTANPQGVGQLTSHSLSRVENVGPSHFACNPSIGANAIKWAWSANWGYTKKSMPHHAGEQLGEKLWVSIKLYHHKYCPYNP